MNFENDTELQVKSLWEEQKKKNALFDSALSCALHARTRMAPEAETWIVT